jgi:hypothetical protein
MNTVPLTEALPWSPTVPRNVLVCDSIETKGDFVIHTMMSQFLASSSSSSHKAAGRVLYWTCTTEQQVATSLKRMGCGDPVLMDRYIGSRRRPLPSDTNNVGNGGQRLTLRSLTTEVGTRLVLASDDEEDDFDPEKYLKQMYKEIKEWLLKENSVDDNTPQNQPMRWIVLDDLSTMATLLGEKLVYCFVTSLLALSHNMPGLGTIMRCSNDVDQLAMKILANEGKDQSGWVGAGGLYQKEHLKYNITQNIVPWERSLETAVDAIVDVLPLPSGFSRDAHGRLIFTETPGGRGWGQQDPLRKSGCVNQVWNKLIINYCVQDSGVRAIRLRSSTTN